MRAALTWMVQHRCRASTLILLALLVLVCVGTLGCSNGIGDANERTVLVLLSQPTDLREARYASVEAVHAAIREFKLARPERAPDFTFEYESLASLPQVRVQLAKRGKRISSVIAYVDWNSPPLLLDELDDLCESFGEYEETPCFIVNTVWNDREIDMLHIAEGEWSRIVFLGLKRSDVVRCARSTLNGEGRMLAVIDAYAGTTAGSTGSDTAYYTVDFDPSRPQEDWAKILHEDPRLHDASEVLLILPPEIGMKVLNEHMILPDATYLLPPGWDRWETMFDLRALGFSNARVLLPRFQWPGREMPESMVAGHMERMSNRLGGVTDVTTALGVKLAVEFVESQSVKQASGESKGGDLASFLEASCVGKVLRSGVAGTGPFYVDANEFVSVSVSEWLLTTASGTVDSEDQ